MVLILVLSRHIGGNTSIRLQKKTARQAGGSVIRKVFPALFSCVNLDAAAAEATRFPAAWDPDVEALAFDRTAGVGDEIHSAPGPGVHENTRTKRQNTRIRCNESPANAMAH